MKNVLKILFFLLIPVLDQAQMHYTDSLKNILKTAKADSTRYSALNGIGEFYVEINGDTAIYYLDKALFIAKKNNRDLNEAMTLARKGYVFGHQGKYAESLGCFQESLDLASDPRIENSIWNPNMPWIRISTPAKSRLTILAGIHLLYGILMRTTGDTAQDIKQLKISREYATKAGDINFIGIANMNLGNAYYKANRIDSALVLEKDAERISKLTGYKKYLPFIQLTLGSIYLKKGNDSLALQYYHKASTTSIEQKTVSSTGNAYFYLAAYYLARHQGDSSLYYAKKRLEIVRYMHSNEFAQAYETLYQSYQLANQLDSSYKYQGLALAARDSDYKSTVKNLADYQKLSFKEQIRSQKLEKEKEDTRARIRTYALLAVIVVILIVAFIIYRNSRQRKKANYLLLEQKDEIEAQRDNLEKKNRELEVETALEKVRTVAMAMQRPDDMLDVCRTICGQLELLGVKEIRNVQTAIIYETRGIYINYEYYRLYYQTFITEVDYTHPIQAEFVKNMLVDGGYLTLILKEAELTDWYEYQKTTNQFVDPHLADVESLNYYWYSIGPVALGMSMYTQVTEDELALFRRFLEVFRLAYRRYKDIELAMEQAREAQIELALERVRARTMAMQHSDELAETAFILFQQFKELGENPDQATIGIINEEEWVIEYWVTMYGSQTNKVFKFSINEPNVTRRIYNGWKAHEKSLVINLSGKELFEFSNYRESMGGAAFNPDERHRVVNVAFFSKGLINVQSKESRSAESVKLLERFAAVFEQTYTRFLDLKKAEKQSREAQIELALERVRARSMAMQKSEELVDASDVLFSELKKLGVETIRTGIGIIDGKTVEIWSRLETGEDAKRKILGKIPKGIHPLFDMMIRGWKEKVPYAVFSMEDAEVPAFYKTAGDYLSYPESLIHGNKEVFSCFFFPEGTVNVVSNVELKEEECKIMVRFARVFGLIYTRFLDLKKAEAQAREAQIETGLERVRSRTMGMQKSEELQEIIKVVYEQFVHLSIAVDHTGFIIDYNIRDKMHIWLADKHMVPTEIIIPYFDSPHWNSYREAKEKGTDFFVNHHTFEEKNKFYKSLFELIPGVDEAAKEHYFTFPGLDISTVLLDTVGLYIENFSGVPYTNEENSTLMRFGKVFQQTYTRFLDLQKSEAQTREAVIEAALERMRTKTMAMHNSSDVAETVAGMFNELVGLGIEKGIRSGIGIINDNAEMEVWTAYSGEDEQVGLVIGRLDMSTHQMLQGVFNNWKAGKSHSSYTLEGDDQKAYYSAINNSKDYSFKFDIETLPEKHYQNAFYFKEGIIYVFSLLPLSAEEVKIFTRFAGVFGLTYTRFLDLQKAEASALQAQDDLVKLQTEKRRAENALTDLQAAQKQLVQSEKMASLGELTAGIAHEIQNPLNFVNNFSEVNQEMIEELEEELNAGNIEEALAIAADIKQNEQKINHHGKRADGIVKGMLQHSRTGGGEKQLTNMNALADEFLRLSYHGLRAKDKLFNAELVTNFDPDLPQINVLPQDMGRVMLNLFNNAFYAVNQKKKIVGAGYNPTVTLETFFLPLQEVGGLKVTDNGIGMPEHIKEKIMQPFFTTKPTGEGTGLGLSLTYDMVVKGHGGSIQVNSVEGEGSEFIVQLPLS